MSDVLVDTNLLIDYSHSKNKILEKFLDLQFDGKITLYVNAVVIAEYLTNNKLTTTKLIDATNEFLKNFKVSELGRKEGSLAGELLRKKLSPSLPDALVASSCLIHNFTLATKNIKHFVKIEGLELYPLGD